MTEQDSIAELLKQALQEDIQEKNLNNEEDKNNYGEEYISQLRTACDNFLKKEVFKVGQIVKWKPNLKNRRLPHKTQPAIVVSVLNEPIVSNKDESGSPYFLENLDIILGIIERGSFFTFYYDSSRFETY